MNFKIDVNSKVKIDFEGPSSSYHATQRRFNQILETKLGVNRSSPVVTPANNQFAAPTQTGLRAFSGLTAAEINLRLRGTDMEGLGEAFVEAERKHGVNALFLTSLAVHESAYGSSHIARDKQNLFGFGAFDGSPYASAYRFDDFEAGIDYVAGYLSENYLSEDGKYFSGYNLEDVGKKYATDPNWANKIEKIMEAFIKTKG